MPQPPVVRPTLQRRHDRLLLGLHSSCGSGAIFAAQLAPLRLTASKDNPLLPQDGFVSASTR
jgi:hypothetical protein